MQKKNILTEVLALRAEVSELRSAIAELSKLSSAIVVKLDADLALDQKIADAVFPATAVRLIIFGGNGDSDMQIKDNESKKFAVSPEDVKGNAVSLPSPPTWAVADETIGSVKASDDGLSVEFTPVGKLGLTQLQCAGVNADGTGVSGSVDVEVIPSGAVNMVITPVE